MIMYYISFQCRNTFLVEWKKPFHVTIKYFWCTLGSIDVTIRDPNGTLEHADIRFNHDKNLSYSVSYIPKKVGGYKVFVKFLGKDINNSPFCIDVVSIAGDALKVKASGPGLISDGNHIGKSTYFDIMTEGSYQLQHFTNKIFSR